MKKGFTDGYKTYDTGEGYGNAKKWRSAFYTRMNKEEAETILQQQTETPHTILGVATKATQAEIKKAFRALIMQWHPDKNAHRLTEAEAMSKKIIAAYTVLTD